MIRPGEIYMADFGPAGPHPVIVISRESLNRGRYALVVPCTSSPFEARSKLNNCVPFVMPTFSASSVTLIFRFASMTSMLMMIAMLVSLYR
jgi:mRNA-degrading endonuclease toxin of MazEF toxin-antitoxin module